MFSVFLSTSTHTYHGSPPCSSITSNNQVLRRRCNSPHPLTGTECLVSIAEKACFLDTLRVMLDACHFVDTPVLPNRITKAVLPLLTVILNPASVIKDGSEVQGGSKNSRKRARNYEGDEVFKTTRDVLCPSAVDAQILLNALDGKLLLCGWCHKLIPLQ
jgi:hypothetical protein